MKPNFMFALAAVVVVALFVYAEAKNKRARLDKESPIISVDQLAKERADARNDAQ